jgi:uncharacterized membrane protein YcaP (DUF421 family)
MDTLLLTAIRTVISFAILLFTTRILGKKLLSQMSFFTYITGIALGNITGEMVVHHKDVKIIDGIAAIALWAVLTISVELLSLKSPKARVLLDGEPSIIIKNGKIQERAIVSNKLNMDDVSMLLRTKNIFSISEVDYAILEPNGKLSVLKKVEHESVTKRDAGIPLKRRRYLPSELIVDGKTVMRNLRETNLSEEWLRQQLAKEGIEDVREVIFAELQSDGTVFIDRKESGQPAR